MSSVNRQQLGELLSAYLDGELSASEAALVERALRDDAHARKDLDELRHTANVVRSLPHHSAPTSIAEDLRARIERAELLGDGANIQLRPVTRRVWAMRSFAAAAVFALAVWGGWWTFSQRPSHEATRMDSRTAPSSQAPDSPSGEYLASEAAGVRNAASRAKGPTFDEKRNAGAATETLRDHPFADEPVRLQVVAANELGRDRVLGRIVDRLRKENVPPIVGPDNEKEKLATPSDAVYHVGKPGVNFADSNTRQVLIRVPTAQVEQIMDEVHGNGINTPAVALVVNAETIRNLDTARSRVRQLAQSQQPNRDLVMPSPARQEDLAGGNKSKDRPFGLFQSLVEGIGVDQAFRQSDAKKDADEPTAAFEAARSTAPDASAEREKDESNQPAAPDAASKKTKQEKPSLVEQKLEALNAHRKAQPAAGGVQQGGDSQDTLTLVVEVQVAAPSVPLEKAAPPKPIPKNTKPKPSPSK